MNVTVGICTWNRAALLEQTLQSFRELTVPAGLRWELIVVNNDCTDDTDAVIARHVGELPLVRVFEPQPGQGYARNAALTAARGEYLLWTDDDVLLDPGWMTALLDAHRRFDADLVFGKAEPWWETAPPSWYGPRFAGHFAVVDLGPTARLLGPADPTGFGVSHSFRLAALKRIGGYNASLGYKKGGGGAGEDTDAFARAFAAGLRVAYTPDARLLHFIPAARCEKGFHQARALNGGAEQLALLRDEAESNPRLPRAFQIPRYFFRKELANAVGYVRGRLAGDEGRAFYHELRLLRLAATVWSLTRRPAQPARDDPPRQPHIHYMSRRFYPDLYGGIEVSGWELVKAWHRVGVKVSVTVENYPDGRARRDEVLPGVTCTRIRPASRRLWRAALLARIGNWAAHLMRESPGEVSVITSGEVVIAAKLARPRRPVLYRLIGVSKQVARATGGEPVGWFQHLTERLAARLADRIVVESSHVRDAVLREFRVPPSRVAVVPTGIDLDRFAVPAARPAGPFTVVCVGRLSPEKDIAFAVKAVALMRNRGVRLVLVGDGPERATLETLAAELGIGPNAEFVGKVPDPERYLAVGHALVLPSRSESYGTALVEGMAAGLPCLGRRSDPPRVQVACGDHIRHGETGFLVDPHDPADLAARLDELAADAGLRGRMGEAGRAVARERYGLAVMARSYLDLLGELTRRS